MSVTSMRVCHVLVAMDNESRPITSSKKHPRSCPSLLKLSAADHHGARERDRHSANPSGPESVSGQAASGGRSRRGRGLLGLLKGDPLAYINVDPIWKPSLGQGEDFQMNDLIAFVNGG